MLVLDEFMGDSEYKESSLNSKVSGADIIVDVKRFIWKINIKHI